MSEGAIEDFEINPECPNCKTPLGPIKLVSLETKQTVTCRGCGEAVEINDSDGVGSGLRELQAAFDSLK